MITTGTSVMLWRTVYKIVDDHHPTPIEAVMLATQKVPQKHLLMLMVTTVLMLMAEIIVMKTVMPMVNILPMMMTVVVAWCGGDGVFVCVCVCVREIERERECGFIYLIISMSKMP